MPLLKHKRIRRNRLNNNWSKLIVMLIIILIHFHWSNEPLSGNSPLQTHILLPQCLREAICYNFKRGNRPHSRALVLYTKNQPSYRFSRLRVILETIRNAFTSFKITPQNFWTPIPPLNLASHSVIYLFTPLMHFINSKEKSTCLTQAQSFLTRNLIKLGFDRILRNKHSTLKQSHLKFKGDIVFDYLPHHFTPS